MEKRTPENEKKLFCGNCGTPLPLDAKFCNQCGAPVPDYVREFLRSDEEETEPFEREAGETEERAAGTEPVQEEKQRRTGKELWSAYRYLILSAAVAAAAVIVILFFLLAGRVNLNPYLDVRFADYDEYGSVTCTFDTAAFREQYGDKIKWKRGADLSAYGLTMEEVDPTDFLLTCCVDYAVDLSADDLTDGSLKNGDTVWIRWNCDDALAREMLGVKLKYSDFSLEVEGLVDPDSVENLFSGVDVTFSGIAPKGEAAVTVSDEANADVSDFVLSAATDLENGDIVTVSLSPSAVDEFRQSYGMDPFITEQNYTVQGLDSFLMRIADIPEDTFAALQTRAEEAMASGVGKTAVDGVAVAGTAYQGACLVCGETEEEGYLNTLYLVYQVNAEAKIPDAEVEESFSFFTYVSFQNLILQANGIFEVNPEEYALPTNVYGREFGKGEDDTAYAKGEYFGYSSLDKLLEAIENEDALTDTTF